MVYVTGEQFRLSERFLENYIGQQPNWGPLGYITYKRSYSRIIEEENRSEEFWETLKRVVEGCYTIQLNHCKHLRLPWNAHKAQKSAQTMFKMMWDFKFLPPGRGLWVMGTDVVDKKGSGALNNCAFVSTKDIQFDFSGPFVWLMDMSMLGVGVAFDCKGAGSVKIIEPKTDNYIFTVEDSREGWCSVVNLYLDAYVGKSKLPTEVDYSKIRPNGSLIKTFGGIAPGPAPLIKCVEEIESVLKNRVDDFITTSDIVDIMNIIGKCVVSGGIRRTAELSLGYGDDEEYINLKDPVKYKKELKSWRWSSNNSVYAYEGMDYSKLAEQCSKNGEPGFVYLENCRKYGRIKDGETWVDKDVEGVNPCSEQSLQDREICCLVEMFPSKHESFEDLRNTLKYAYLYAKTVTLIPTHSERTNQVMLQNRRIGLSMAGIIDAFEKFGRKTFLQWLDKGYERITELDIKYSRWLCIPTSIKKTTVKPGGTIPLLPGVTPGIHYPHSEYYIRRIRIQNGSPLLDVLTRAGYQCEESKYNDNTMVFSFPVKTENYRKGKREVTIWEQMENAAAIQYYWSDNCISQTVTVKKEEIGQIKDVLECFEDKIKTVSFLPLDEHNYEQAPYEEIDKEKYEFMIKDLKSIKFRKKEIIDDKGARDMNKYCDSDKCQI